MAATRRGRKRGPYRLRARSPLVWSDDGTGKARGRRYRTLLVRFNTASREHAEWIRHRISERYGLHGGLWCEDGMYQLTYAKRASRHLLPLLYPAPNVPCLSRKREVWRHFEREGGLPVALN